MKQLLFLSAALLLIWLTVCSGYTCPDECINGDCVPYLGNLTCECFGNWSGLSCDEFICDSSNPCLNGGICSYDLTDVSQYLCTCPLGYTGNQCQYKVPSGYAETNCTTNSCYGNGTCYDHPNSSDRFFCDCFPGYYGPMCNFTENLCEDVDEAVLCSGQGHCVVNSTVDGTPIAVCICEKYYLSSPFGSMFCTLRRSPYNCFPLCVNGTCTLEGECYCNPGYSGEDCSVPIDICEGRCYNGGTCSPVGHYFNCTCPMGYTGERCEYLIDPCSQESCNNNGRCVSEVSPSDNGYYFLTTGGSVSTRCECEYGFVGDDCGQTVVLDICTLNPCGPGDCHRDNSSSGFFCECPEELTGSLCNQPDYCSLSPCNQDRTTGCVNTGTDGHLCICARGWSGPDCDMDINECASNPCGNGDCLNSLGSYACSCWSGWTGTNCDLVVTCDDKLCFNGGTCEMTEGIATCGCSQGFHGEQCELETCQREDCQQLAGNGVCNELCFTEGCGFDGGDCFNSTQSPSPSPWANCSLETACRLLYRDSHCDVQCNTPDCLFDGFDCSAPPRCARREVCVRGASDNVCNPDCNTAECPYDAEDCNTQNLAPGLVKVYVVTGPERPFVSPWREEFIADLSSLVNAALIFQGERLITARELADLHRPLLVFPSDQLSSELLIYEVTLKLDLSYCRSNCPTTVEDVANVIQGTLDSGNGFIGPYGVAAATSTPDASGPGPGSISLETVLGSLVGVALLSVLATVAVIMILRKRQRSSDTGAPATKRVKGVIWRPGSPSEGAGSRSSPLGDGKKTGKSGTNTLTSKEVTPTPSVDTDRYIAEGSVKAHMEPRGETLPIKWGGVTKPVIHTPNDSAVVGQVGQDKRQWTAAHARALQDPIQVRTLVEKFRVANGRSNDVNARGPGGLTPLMLVIMKRHSSHETMLYPPSSRGSSDSGNSDHNDHTTPLLPAATQRGAYYHTPSHFSPIDSSVSALIDAKVDLDVTNDYSQTALHLACACSRGDYVEQLLEAGANPNVQDNWGQSALQTAIVAAAEGAFMLLLNHPRTDVNLKSDGGVTPLIAAVKVVNQFMVKQLLKKNVDISTIDKDGRTAVHWAAMVDNLEALKLLIRQGPDAIKDAQDSKGQTALFLAAREGSASCVKHLIDCFANATLMDSLEQSPAHIAFQKQHMDIVEMLRSTTQGPFPIHPHAPLQMRGIPNMQGGFPMGSQFAEDQGPYAHQQLVHPKKSKVKKNGRTESDLATPTYISNPAFFGISHQTGERHQTFGDLSASSRHPQGMGQNYPGPYPPTSENMTSAQYPMTTEYQGQKLSPVSHGNTGYLHPITPPDSATLKVDNTPQYSSNSPGDPSTSIAVTSGSAFDEIQAVSDLITSMAYHPPTTHQYSQFPSGKSTTAYSDTTGGPRLTHYPMVDQKPIYHGSTADASAGHTHTSPPHTAVDNTSPSSVYPSPPHSNELQSQTTFNPYQYQTSQACSPPSLTPSPESREEALARQQFQHDIETYGATILDGEHHTISGMNNYHSLGFPLESSV